MDYSRQRLKRLFKGSGLDAIVIVNTGSADPNFHYLTQFTSGVFESNMLIALPDRMVLITDPLEYETAKAQERAGMEIVCISTSEQFKKVIRKNLAGKTIGFNGSFLPYASYLRLKKRSRARKLVDAKENLSTARLVKFPDEIEKIGKANRITKYALSVISSHFKIGMTENELAAKFDYIIRERGAEGNAFPTIVAFGANSALPHHSPDQTRLKPNSFVLIDCGARYMNYCADMTRTFIFKPDIKSAKYKKMSEMLGIVKLAQSSAEKKIAAGRKGSEAHLEAERVIDGAAKSIYKGTFIHALGHSLGIETHDGPGLSPGNKEKLVENMVVTNEPGIYVPGFGGVRIEDDVVVKKGTSIVL
jgi:Xaa-Pro dipeptidase